MPTSKVEGMPPGGILHMDHKLIIERAIPTSGTLHIEKKIVNVYDRGEKGAKIMVEVVAKNENNEVVARNILGYLKKNCGGFGGHRPPASDIVIPDTQPDTILEESYPLNAALLYRLTGDTYPLHVDPVLAQKSGFERPIVHGLCSLGYACRMLIAYLFPEEPERMKSIECQFRSIAMPGDTFRIHVWKCGDQEALFRMVNKDTLKPILDFGRICWK
jgi:acyl dehydratase